MADQEIGPQLLRRIKSRRRTISAYLRLARPRAERLTYVSVISSALAAALTAGPALGGPTFMKRVAGTWQLGEPSEVWRPLCLLAMVVSVVAAISANLSKSKNTEARIIAAEACSAELEGLQTLVEFDQLPVKEAVKLYQQYVARVPFVPDTADVERRSRSRKR
ncbi:MAG: hypothetical protein ACR2LI_13405 [Propionibacteriaceae bacterium]